MSPTYTLSLCATFGPSVAQLLRRMWSRSYFIQYSATLLSISPVALFQSRFG